MIAYVRGKLTHIQEESVLIDVGGIGYEIICANPFAFQSSLDEEVLIFTYHHVRDDIEQLFGFKNEDEKYLFTKLISVSGIGPKSAITILSNARVNEFISAVEMEDENYLTQFPGVGKKTARQIILDLKGKLQAHISARGEGEQIERHTDYSVLNEVKEALKALGYAEREINPILPQLQRENNEKTDELIKKALMMLSN